MSLRLGFFIFTTAILLSSNAYSARTCEEIFSNVRSHFPNAAAFMPTDDRLKFASTAAVVARLRDALPAGSYTVVVNGADQATLRVSYVGISARFSLGARTLVQTDSIPIVVSDLSQTQGSMSGLDAGVHIGGRVVTIANSFYNGNDAVYPGLTRRDVAMMFTFSPTGSVSIEVKEGVAVKAPYGPKIEPYETSTTLTLVKRDAQ